MMPCPACGRGDVYGDEPAFESLSPLLAALKSPPIGGEGDKLPADVRRLVIAARVVAFEDVGMEAMAELDDASEAFSDRVKWDDEPAEECVGGVIGAVEVSPAAARSSARKVNEWVSRALDGTTSGELCEPFAVNDELVAYIQRYGGRCRDCADYAGVCPGSGLPCGESDKAIRWVLKALNYGLSHGFVTLEPALDLIQPTSSGDVGKLCERLRGHSMALAVNAKYGLDLRSDLTNRDAVSYGELLAEAAARISALEKALEPFASQHTVGETLMTCEVPPWFGLSPEQRLAMLAERKKSHDANILNARALLNPTLTEER